MTETDPEQLSLQTPPLGSTIEITDAFDGRIYRWRAPTRHPAQWMMVGLGGIVLFMCALLALTFTLDDDGPDLPPGVLLLVIGLQLCFALWLLWCGLTRRACETLTLSRDVLYYDTGPASLPFPVVLFMWPMAIQSSGWFSTVAKHPTHLIRKRYDVPIAELGPIELSRVGERQRLTVDHGADRIEIGLLLREPEREWLASVLREWRESR